MEEHLHMWRAAGPLTDLFSESYFPLGKLTNHRCCYHAKQRICNPQLYTAVLEAEGSLLRSSHKSHVYQENLLPLQLTCLLKGLCANCLPAQAHVNKAIIFQLPMGICPAYLSGL